jgi:hypothetical protein
MVVYVTKSVGTHAHHKYIGTFGAPDETAEMEHLRGFRDLIQRKFAK